MVNLETGLGALDISRAVSPRELQRMEGEALGCQTMASVFVAEN